MNTDIIITRKLVMVSFVVLLTTVFGFSAPPGNIEIIKRIENLNTIIDLKITNEVTDQIISLIEKRRSDSEALLGRTSLYFPAIENALREKNLPDELKYIAVIESGLLPDVTSHQGAAGIWQFMKPTAELFGLKIDKHIDERKDLAKATDKALDYLKLLYEAYGNWTLALAAYNCGTGNINKALKKANGNADYWAIQQYLPKETQRYIPRFIAASYLMNYYYIHNIQPREPAEDIKYTVSVKVTDKIDFKALSKEFQMELQLIRYLNPMFRKDFIPESSKSEYFLTLPAQKMVAYIEKYNSSDNIVSNFKLNRNKASDEFPNSGERTKVVINYLSGFEKRNFAVRDNLKDSSLFRRLELNGIVRDEPFRIYRLKKKESLADVAAANNIELNQLMAINNIDESQGLPPGSIVRLSR
jgi:membrane-bound lytic murein transglycosylase D